MVTAHSYDTIEAALYAAVARHFFQCRMSLSNEVVCRDYFELREES